MPSNAKLGIKCATYRNTGTWAAPVWSEVTCIENWTVNPNWGSAEIKSRATRMVLNAKTLMGLTVSGRVLASDSGDANYTAIMAALMNDDTLDVMVLNGNSTANGVTGYRFEAQVFGGSEDQGPDVVVYDEIELKPAFTANKPQSVTVTAGAPVFTELAPN